MKKIKLEKIIAKGGYCSRGKAEELKEQVSVTESGKRGSVGDKADPAGDVKKEGDDVIPAVRAAKRYIMLNKPRGYVTTMQDEMGRKTAAELLNGIEERLYPVGRLDRNSEGLLLFTNDGQFANDIMHPSRHVSKTYRVTIDGRVSEDQLSRLMSGVELDDGSYTLPCNVEVLSEAADRTVLRFVIKQGLNRQIRRMCTAVGLNVGRLRRTAVGGVKLGMLKPGEWRELTKDELRILRAAVGNSGKNSNKGGRK